MNSFAPIARGAGHAGDDGRTIAIDFVGNVLSQPFAGIAESLGDLGTIALKHRDFGAVVQALQQTSPADFLLVHLDHRWFYDLIPAPEMLDRARELLFFVEGWTSRNGGKIILNTIADLPHRPIREAELEARARVLELNRMIYSAAASNSRIGVLDLAALTANYGACNAFRERNRFVVQFPYERNFTKLLIAEYAAIVREDFRARRKAVVVDADNTLWRGVVGEVGVKGIGIGDDYPDVLHKALQNQLLDLKRLGFLIAVVTKNNEADFLEVFKHNAMPLSLDDLVTFRANWDAKSENIRSIASELNIGLDAIVFVDDNPFEIEEVRTRTPEVECVLFEPDKTDEVLGLLSRRPSLRAASLTQEDLAKTEQYRAEAERASAQKSAESLEDYLSSLGIELFVSENERQHVPRIAQLTNKTNQFNLTTRRYTEADILDFMNRGKVYDFRVRDRFGDLGIVGVAIVLDGMVDTFLMSCRALGRQVEREMLRIVSEGSENRLKARYSETAKNAQTREFYDSNGFELVSDADGVREYIQSGAIKPAGHVTVVR